jgi:hypothetical protein
VAGPTISAVAFCPHPPLLLPEIAAGAAIETQSLRLACTEALDRLIGAAPSQILVLGADGVPVSARDYAPGLADPHADDGGRELPLSLFIADWLLGERAISPPATYLAIGADAGPVTPWPELTGHVGLLVMGDGSARRSVKAPGYLDERAQPFDDAVVAALAAGSPDALAALDLALAATLLAAGAAAWVAAANLLKGQRRWRGEILYTGAPYGVMYTVASWLPA